MNVKELRKSKGLSMDAMARILGVTRQTIYNYETGAREMSIEVLKAYATYFDVSIDSITADVPVMIGELKPIKAFTTKDEMEQQLLERFRSLTFDNKLKAISYITTLTK